MRLAGIRVAGEQQVIESNRNTQKGQGIMNSAIVRTQVVSVAVAVLFVLTGLLAARAAQGTWNPSASPDPAEWNTSTANWWNGSQMTFATGDDVVLADSPQTNIFIGLGGSRRPREAGYDGR